jgi:hypothetical protein
MEGFIFDTTPYPAHAQTQVGQIPVVGECMKVENGSKNVLHSENACFCAVQDFSLLKGKE